MRRVSLRVEFDAEPSQSVADARANLRRVFADAAGEDDSVRAVQRGQIRADVFSRAVAENFDGEPRPSVVGFVRFVQ